MPYFPEFNISCADITKIDNFYLSEANCAKETPHFPVLFSTGKASRNCSQNFLFDQVAKKPFKA